MNRPLTGRTANFPADIVINAGALLYGTPPAQLGTTVGGIKFDPGKTMRQVGYDGQLTDVVGGDRLVRWKPMLSCTLQELGPSTTGKQISVLEPGSTEADSGHQSTLKGRIKTITPKSGGILLSAGDYVTDLLAIFELGGGGIYQYAQLHMPYALCTKYDIQSADGAEVKVAAQFEARLSAADAVATPGKCPYELVLSEKFAS